MLTLFGTGPMFGLPEGSAYVTKTEVHLRMAGLAYRKERARPGDSPKGQLPFLDDRGQRIADSTFIRAYLEREYGVDLDAHLTEIERAQAWAIERMLENHFAWAMIPGRYDDDANFARGPARWFDDAPEELQLQLQDDLRRRVRANVFAVGIGRHTPDEVVSLGVRSLASLSTLLGGKLYLFGDRPCGVDATCFAILANTLTPFFDTALRREAETFPNLVAYTDRMMRKFYPAHRWGTAMCKAA